MFRKYGVANPMSLDSVKDKIKETNIKRYGVEWSAQNKEINQKQLIHKLKNMVVFLILKSKENKYREIWYRKTIHVI